MAEKDCPTCRGQRLKPEVLHVRAAGASIIDPTAMTDGVIDLGPEGGSGGGRIVSEGPPEAVAGVATSYTGRFLRELL